MSMKSYLESGYLYMSRAIYVLVSMLKNINIIIIEDNKLIIYGLKLAFILNFNFGNIQEKIISF